MILYGLLSTPIYVRGFRYTVRLLLKACEAYQKNRAGLAQVFTADVLAALDAIFALCPVLQEAIDKAP